MVDLTPPAEGGLLICLRLFVSQIAHWAPNVMLHAMDGIRPVAQCGRNRDLGSGCGMGTVCLHF